MVLAPAFPPIGKSGVIYFDTFGFQGIYPLFRNQKGPGEPLCVTECIIRIFRFNNFGQSFLPDKVDVMACIYYL